MINMIHLFILIIWIILDPSVKQNERKAERQNRTVIPVLSKLIDIQNNKDWDHSIPDAEFAINNSLNRSIKTTPSMALYGVNQTKTNDDIVRFIEQLNLEARDGETQRNEIIKETKNCQIQKKSQ